MTESTLPPGDIPAQCVGCPMLSLAADNYHQMVADNEVFIQNRVAENADCDLQSATEYHNMVVTEQDEITKQRCSAIRTDIDNILSFGETEPGALDMMMLDFVRTYRTEDNLLGDSALQLILATLYEGMPDKADDIAATLPVHEALKMAASSADHLEAVTQNSLLGGYRDTDKILVDTEAVYRQAMAGSAEAYYGETVGELIAQCIEGATQKRVGLIQKRLVRFCGSTAFRKRKVQ